ncbi:MAG: DUF3459 domain-containing protein, partial [Nocardioidaceae bacterium]
EDLQRSGQHPFWDRDEVHEIYAEWRRLFDEYHPPRAAVAEACVHPSRRTRYASPSGLGQAFNFDLLQADWSPEQFRRVVADNLDAAETSGASSTWVLSNHDVVRHATRYGLPRGEGDSGQDGKQWLLTDGSDPVLDREAGLRRARAASLLLLALPGSAYLYQGEELGLHEVADLPVDTLQDPAFRRSGGAEKGRDGCRVPLPWTAHEPSFGFGAGACHLPQPAWFGDVAAQSQAGDPESTLTMYRTALRLRRRLQGAERLEWVPSPDSVLHFVRPGGWRCVTNFGSEHADLPAGEVVVSSGPLTGGRLPGDTTVWLA